MDRPPARRESTSFPPWVLSRVWLTANALSVSGLALCMAAGIVLAAGGSFVSAGALFVVGAVCDWLDGPVARKTAIRNHPAGALLDSVCDKVGEAAVVGGFLVALDDRLAVDLLMGSYILGSLTSYIKAAANEHGMPIVWSEVRVFGRGGRAAILASALVLPDAITPANPLPLLTLWLAILLAFNLVTAGWRLVRVMNVLRRAAIPAP